MKKYDMRICKCGRIHMIPNEKIENALENNKNLLLICAGCGAATLIGGDLGLDIEPDWFEPDKKCYMMYSREFSSYKSKSILATDFEKTDESKGIEEIVYSHGIKVPMMTGQYATDYFNGIFSDRWYPDFYKIERRDITVEEIMKFIDDYRHDRTTVNMDWFMCQTPEDMLKEISCYMIEGFNWKGTKWESKE